jgi:putative DNA primase/helicase
LMATSIAATSLTSTAGAAGGDVAYLLHPDGAIPAGGFQNWQDGKGWDNWFLNIGRKLNAAEKQDLQRKHDAARKARDEERDRIAAEARDEATRQWNGAPECTSHPYLTNKNITPHGARILDQKLVIPVCDVDGGIHSLHFIKADGEKRLLKGGAVKGFCYRIDGEEDRLCIVEGFATAATIHTATGRTVIVAFFAGNLLPVAEAIRKEHSDAEIVICADDDKNGVGLSKAKAAARAINGFVAVPEFGPKRRETDTDFNDLADLTGISAVKQCIEAATAQKHTGNGQDASARAGSGSEQANPGDAPEAPRPLMRELPRADPFPVDALGDVLGPAARAIHDRVRAPMAIGGQSVLAAATLVVQAHADVQLPTNQVRPLSGFYLTVAATGERKTASDNEALWPLRRRELALREKHDPDLSVYTNDKLAWDKAREKAVKLGKGDRGAIKQALDALGPPPMPPLEPLLTCPEPTFEGMCKLFAVGWPSLGIFASEGGQFIGGHGLSDDTKLRTAAGLSAAWDGEAIKRVRAGDGVMVLPGRRLAMHLMAQPDVASVMLNDPLLTDQGILSRVLVTAPDPASGTRMWREAAPASDVALKRYGARLLDILEMPLPLAVGQANELEPRSLPLAPEARRRWIAFADHVEGAITPNGDLDPVRGLANKLPEHAARMAAVLTLVRDIHAGEIAGAEMEAGIALAEHYAAEALRLFGGSRVNIELQLAQRLLDWLLATWVAPVVSLPDIYRIGPHSIRDMATARRMVGILVEHGWLVSIPGGAIVAGKPRREAWRIIRE